MGFTMFKTSKVNIIQWVRKGVQVGFLFILGEFTFYGIFRCPFAVPYLSCNNCPVIQCPGQYLFWPFWLLLPVSLVLFGRGFCGWACPGGLVTGLISRISLLKNKLKQRVVQVGSWLKYLVLIVASYFFFVLANPRWAIPIRTGEFSYSVRLTFEHADTLWLWRTGFILGTLVLTFLISGLWCGFLCPTGGALECLKRFGVFKFYKTDQCTQCKLCEKKCELDTQPGETNCTNCGDCQYICPVSAIKFGWPKS